MPMIDTLLVDRSPGETRVAALSGETVIEVHYHHAGEAAPGAVYCGRIGKRLPDASAVFVEIGDHVPAFMNCGSKPPDEGARVCVRVVQPARFDKGAKVTLVKEDSDAVLPDGPGLMTPAPHPLTWCLDQYGDTVGSVVVSPNDADGVVKGLVEDVVPVLPWTESEDMFEHYGVNDAIEQALDPVVPIPGGGTLHIEPTAALVAVDIDAGPMPAADANAAAIEVLAHQLRLRAAAGPVIVDLIPTKKRTALVDQMTAAVEDDPVPTRITGLTPEGRLELNRRRLRPSLAEQLRDPRDSQKPAPDALAFEALRQCVRAGRTSKAARVSLTVHADVAALLKGRLRPALDEAHAVLKSEIELKGRSDVPHGHLDVTG